LKSGLIEKQTSRRNEWVIEILIYTPAKAELEDEVQAWANSVKCNRLFSDSKEKS
jgi:hypothetical protein